MKTINIEEIKPAKTETLETGHHSYEGRAEFMRALIRQNGWDKLSPDSKDQKFKDACKALHSAVKARYPHHASEVHLVNAYKSYLKSLAKKAARAEAKAAEATAPKGEKKSSKKARSVTPKGMKKGSKSGSKKSASKSAEVPATTEQPVIATAE